jgi:hypothetical protein
VLPLLLPIAVAVLGGDAIAGESQTGTLRYILIRPVGRTHLLLAKLATVVAFVLLAVFVVAAVSYAEGRLLLGKAPATGTVSLSGSTLTQQELGWRTALALGYVIISMLGVAAIALFFSALRGSAIGAALGTIGVAVVDRVVGATRRTPPSLPADSLLLAFVDLFRDPILWRDVAWAGGSAGISDCFHAGCVGELGTKISTTNDQQRQRSVPGRVSVPRTEPRCRTTGLLGGSPCALWSLDRRLGDDEGTRQGSGIDRRHHAIAGRANCHPQPAGGLIASQPAQQVAVGNQLLAGCSAPAGEFGSESCLTRSVVWRAERQNAARDLGAAVVSDPNPGNDPAG